MNKEVTKFIEDSWDKDLWNITSEMLNLNKSEWTIIWKSHYQYNAQLWLSPVREIRQKAEHIMIVWLTALELSSDDYMLSEHDDCIAIRLKSDDKVIEDNWFFIEKLLERLDHDCGIIEDEVMRQEYMYLEEQLDENIGYGYEWYSATSDIDYDAISSDYITNQVRNFYIEYIYPEFSIDEWGNISEEIIIDALRDDKNLQVIDNDESYTVIWNPKLYDESGTLLNDPNQYDRKLL